MSFWKATVTNTSSLLQTLGRPNTAEEEKAFADGSVPAW